MNVKQEISALLRMEAQDTAILRLAAILDEHLLYCPHVEPPVARVPRAPRTIGGYAPTSHDEQVMVDRMGPLLVDEQGLPLPEDWSLREVMMMREARASAALDGDTLSVEVRDGDD